MSARALPGNRVEANRAGMTATTCGGYAESTVGTVDEGCTANHSTPRQNAVLRSDVGGCSAPHILMNIKVAAACALVVGGGAGWYALSAGKVRSAPPSSHVVPAAPLDARGTALANEIARLGRHQQPVASPHRGRDLFRFAAPAPQKTAAAPIVLTVPA